MVAALLSARLSANVRIRGRQRERTALYRVASLAPVRPAGHLHGGNRSDPAAAGADFDSRDDDSPGCTQLTGEQHHGAAEIATSVRRITSPLMEPSLGGRGGSARHCSMTPERADASLSILVPAPSWGWFGSPAASVDEHADSTGQSRLPSEPGRPRRRPVPQHQCQVRKQWRRGHQQNSTYKQTGRMTQRWKVQKQQPDQQHATCGPRDDRRPAGQANVKRGQWARSRENVPICLLGNSGTSAGVRATSRSSCSTKGRRVHNPRSNCHRKARRSGRQANQSNARHGRTNCQ